MERVLPPKGPPPDGYETHHFKTGGGGHTYSSRTCSMESFHRELSDLAPLMRAVHCELMHEAGDLLAAQHWTRPPITADQVQQMVWIIIKAFGLYERPLMKGE